ncbi:hypothetical protein Tco_0636250 [Tanacetum coccineum]
MESQSETTQIVSALKLPVLKTGDYDLWSMRMEQYLTHTYYALWEHLLKFHRIKDAKTLWEAIKTKFGGNKESKKMQKTILKQQYENFTASRSERLDKTYDRNKLIYDTIEAWMTCTNNLKMYEAEIKSQSRSSSNSQNVAFVSSKNTSSTNEAVNTAHEVSTANSQGQASSSSYADDVMFSFFVSQSNSQQLDNEDLEQPFKLIWHQGIRGIEMEMFLEELYNCLEVSSVHQVDSVVIHTLLQSLL